MKNILLTFFILFASSQIVCAKGAAKETNKSNLPYYEIRTVIHDYANRNKQKILVDPRVKARVSLYGKNISDIDSSDLYTILNMHGYSLVKIDDLDIVMPLVNIKQSNAKINNNNSQEFDSSEIVTTLITVKNIPVSQLIPILRPLVPQQGHLAAYNPTNKIILTDTYSNSKRLTEIIKFLDAENEVTFTMKCKAEN